MTQSQALEKFEKTITEKVNTILTATSDIRQMLSNLAEPETQATEKTGIGSTIKKLLERSGATSNSNR